MSVETRNNIGGAKAVPSRGAVVFAVLATLAFLALAGRLVQLQIMDHDKLAVEAARQVYGVVRDRDRRGDVVDARGLVLATSVAVKACALDPKVLLEAEYANPEKLVAGLRELLSLTPQEVQRLVEGIEKKHTYNTPDGPQTGPRRFVWVKRRLSDAEYGKLSGEIDASRKEASDAWRNRRRWLKIVGERKVARDKDGEKQAQEAVDGWRKVALTAEGRYAGVFFPPEYERVYPQGQLASHIMGFGNIDGDGLEGVERAYHDLLKGIPVNRVVARDARSRALSTLVEDDRSTDGMTVQLTIDAAIQAIVEDELRQAVDRFKAEAPDVTANAVVMDPFTGDILAIANYPTFDPNRPAEFPVRSRRNDVVAAVQEPGSTFKPLMISASIEEGLARFDEDIDCTTYRMANGRIVKDIHPYGHMTLEMAVAKSSNPAMVRVGERLGPKKMREYVKRYGFGETSGSKLTGEVRGRVTAENKWSSYTMGSVPMGYEINVTALQMATAYCVIANGGMLPQPNIIKSIKDPSGRIALKMEPTMRRRVISPETAAKMREVMRKVITSGTGRRANIEEYEIGGKTGTANMIANEAERAQGVKGYSKRRHTANFVALAPWDKPRVVVCVSIRDTNKYGGEASSPVGAGICRRVLGYLGVPTGNGESVKAGTSLLQAFEPPPVPAAYTVGDEDDENKLSEEVDPRLWEEWVEDDTAVG